MWPREFPLEATLPVGRGNTCYRRKVGPLDDTLASINTKCCRSKHAQLYQVSWGGGGKEGGEWGEI